MLRWYTFCLAGCYNWYTFSLALANEFKTFNFNRFQYDTSVRLIFVGPIPHSTKDKGEYSSVIARMEEEEGFPKIVRLGTEGSLKITKTNLKDAIIKEIESNYLDTN